MIYRPGPSCGKTSDALYTIDNPKPAICYPTPIDASYSYWRLELSAEETTKNPGGVSRLAVFPASRNSPSVHCA